MPSPNGGTTRDLTGTARQLQQFGSYAGSFYGPGDPLPPVQEGQPTRQWDFAPGQNMTQTPRHTEPFNFKHLRAFSNVELVRMAIETRKDQLERLDWMVKPKDNKAARKQERDPRAIEVEKFLSKPDGQHNFQEFFRAVEEDLLALDAPCIEKLRTRGGKLYGLNYVDGSTINLLVDETGRIPNGPDDLAYQQVIRGMVWKNLKQSDIIYSPRNVRTGHLYGFGPVEQIIVTINTIIRRQGRQLAYFTEGNVPQGIINAPEGYQNDQIRDLQEWFDQRISGNAGQQNGVIWTPFGSKYESFKDSPIKDEFDEWLARIVSNAFSLPPTPFVRQMNRSTAGADQDRAMEEGLEPLKLWRKRLIDRIITEELGYDDLEFAWREDVDIDPKVQAEIDDKRLKNGSATIDEVRDRAGDEPYEDGTGAVARIYVADGAMTLEQIDKAGELKANPQPEPVVAGPNGAPQPGKPAPGKVAKYSDDQPRDDHGRWTAVGGAGDAPPGTLALFPYERRGGDFPVQQLSPEEVQAAFGIVSQSTAPVLHPGERLQNEQLDEPEDHIPWERQRDLLPGQSVRENVTQAATGEPIGSKKNSGKSVGPGVTKFSPDQPRDERGRWTDGGSFEVTREQLYATVQQMASNPDVHENIIGMKVDGKTIFHPEASLGLKRDEMPQIPDEDRAAFLAKYEAKLEVVDPNTLGPTQAELDSFKVGLAATGVIHPDPPIVSSDGKIIDGHHHWAGAVVRAQLDESTRITVHRVNADRATLMRDALSFDHAHGIKGEELADKVLKALAKYSDDQPRDDHGRWTSGGGTASRSDPGQSSAQALGLVDKDGNITDDGMGVLASNWIGGNWHGYQEAAEAVVRGETAKQFAEHMNNAAGAIAVHGVAEAAIEKINGLKPLDYPLYRGLVGVNYKVGDTFSESLTTWTAKENLARNFAHDAFDTASTGEWGHANGVVMKVAGSEMHGINITDINPNRDGENEYVNSAAEHLTSGEYRVTSITGKGARQTYNVERIGPAQASDLKRVIEVVWVKYSDDQPRDDHGRWTSGFGGDVLYEVGPNPDNAELTAQWNALSDSAKAAITDQIGAEFTPKVLEAAGIQGSVEPAMGGFEGEVNPSLVLTADKPFEAAGVLGETFGQKAMVVMSDKPMEGLSPVGMVSVQVGEGADAGTLRSLQSKIGDLADGFTYRDGQMQVLNFSGKSDEEFATAIDNRLDNSYVIGHGTVYSAYIEASNYAHPENDSHGNPWRQTAGTLREAFSQRLGEALAAQGKTRKVSGPCGHASHAHTFEKAKGKKLPPRIPSPEDKHARTVMDKLAGKIKTAFGKAAATVSQYATDLLDQQQNSGHDLGQAFAIADTVDLADILNLQEPLLEAAKAILADAAPRALAAVGVPAASALVDQVSNAAVDYAETRAAELVSLNGDESLIASTRDMLRSIISNGLADNIGTPAIAENIRNATAFSDYRANLIATTEVAMANGHAKKVAWDALENEGATMAKQWFISADENVCPICILNADQGEIPYDDEFSSGDDMEPAHPGCQCAVAVRVINPGNSAAQE